jgi:hypothetical protein
VDEPGETHAGDVSRGTEDAFEVPDGFCAGDEVSMVVRGDRGMGDSRLWVDFVEEAAAVVFGENAGEAPGLFVERLDVLDFDYEDVAWLGGLDVEGAG